MIERLQRALEHVDELSPDEQEDIAQLIEERTESLGIPEGSLAGSMPDLPDDTEETLLRWRRESSPTPPLDEQLHWLEEE